MNLEIFNQIRKTINNPLIDSKLVENKHLIYIKYTSGHYYKYIIELLETLCKKSKYENKKLLFHTSLHFILKIFYNCGNYLPFKDFDLLILCVFSLGIKSTENQHKSPTIHKLKRIYPEKFSCYKNEDLKIGEILCIKLLDYNINILTSYECLFYLLKIKYNSLYLLDSCIQELDNIIFEGSQKYVFKRPIDIAKESIEKAKFKEKQKKNVNKINDNKIYNNSKGHYNINNDKISSKQKKALPNNESISTNASSAANISNYINNCENHVYYSYKSKSLINNKLKDIYNSGKKKFYQDEEENKNKEINNETININILNNNFDNSYSFISPEKTRYNYVNKISTNKKKNTNALVHFNDNFNYLRKKKIDSLFNFATIENHSNKEKMSNIKKIDNLSSLHLLRKPMKKKNAFSETSQKGRSKPNSNTSRGKYKNLINNTIKNNIINNKNIQNRKNINFNYDKLNELCNKMNFDIFNH